MKTILPLFALMIMLISACDNTKVQLRAPLPKESNIKTVTDSISTIDSTKTALKQ